MAETDDISIEKVVGVYDFEGNEIGACMQCVSDGMDYGYVICDTDKNIIEYSVGAGYPFLYDVLSDSITEGYVMSQTDCIFTTDKLQYYVEVSDGTENYLFAGDGSYLETDGMCVASSNAVSGWGDIIKNINLYSGNSAYTRLEYYYNYSTITFSKTFIKNTCNRYACAVVAMLSMCAQEGYFQLRNSDGTYNLDEIRHAFNMLWSLSGTTVYDTEGTVQLGTTYDHRVAGAIEEYCLYATSETAVVGRIYDPSWSQIINHVSQGKSSMYGTAIYVENNGNVIDDGHAVNVVGYATYRENSTGNILKFLMVGDGWNDYPRYLLFDTSKFHDTYYVYIS